MNVYFTLVLLLTFEHVGHSQHIFQLSIGIDKKRWNTPDTQIKEKFPNIMYQKSLEFPNNLNKKCKFIRTIWNLKISLINTFFSCPIIRRKQVKNNHNLNSMVSLCFILSYLSKISKLKKKNFYVKIINSFHQQIKQLCSSLLDI